MGFAFGIEIKHGIQHLRRWLLLAICVLAQLVPHFAHSAASEPSAVDVGIYLNNIPAVSLKEKKFQVDFNIWFRWKGDAINPSETFKIFNGTIDVKDGLVTKTIGDTKYASQRVQATIYRNFDVARFPLDDQTLKIQIEDSKSDGTAMAYVADQANTNVSSKVTVPGWTVGKIDSYNSVTSYKTNYGDISLAKDAEARFPRYTFAIELKRAGYGYFLKYYSMLFLAAALTSIGFIIRSDLVDSRFFLCTSSIFMAALTGIALDANLPQSDSFGMGDRLYHLTMAFIFVCTLAFIVLDKLFDLDEVRTDRLSRRIGLLLPGTYVAAVVLIVGLA